MPRQIVFVASRNPLEGRTGHPHYVRAHARAVIRAGFEPRIFCAERQSDIVQTDFGIVHQVRSVSLRLAPKNPGHGFRKSLMMWHAPLIAASVVDGECGPLVPPGDAVALAEAMRRLLGDPLLRKRLAGAARRTFEARFSAEVFTEALRKTYAELGFEGDRG